MRAAAQSTLARHGWRRSRYRTIAACAEAGQAALEFVLILPFLVLFFLLLVDLGILMYEYVSVANAAREGARYGAVNCPQPNGFTGDCTVAAIQQRAAERSGGIVGAAEVSVNWVDRNSNGYVGDRGDSVVVRINHDYQFRFFFLPSALFPGGAHIPVVSCADMRLEQRENSSRPAGPGCT